MKKNFVSSQLKAVHLYLRILTIVAFGVISSISSYGQIDFTPLTHEFNNHKSEIGTHFACLLQKNGKTLFRKGADDFDIADVTSVGSFSQWLTAALVMTLVDQEKISLDDKVSRYLPIYETYGKKFITIRQCLSHQTGIEYPKSVGKLFEKAKYASLEEEVNAFASKHEILYNPGTAFNYNNIGIDIAARIAEIVTQKSFDVLITERILKPLGMRNTSFSAKDKVNPSFSAYSTANEMNNFLSMLLNKGVFNSKKILSEKSIAEMETLQMDKSFMKNAPSPMQGFTYGLGEWILSKDIDDKSTILGYSNMYGSWMFFDRCKGYTFVLLSKTPQTESKKLMYDDLKKALDEIMPVEGCNGY